MSKNLCLIDWSIDISLQGPRVYIYTLLKELQPNTTRIQIPNYTESVYKTIKITKENIKLFPPWQAGTPLQTDRQLPNSPSVSSADSPVMVIGRLPCHSHRHRHIISYGLSPVQLLLHRQPSSSATHPVDKTPPSYPVGLYSTKHGHVPKNGVNNCKVQRNSRVRRREPSSVMFQKFVHPTIWKIKSNSVSIHVSCSKIGSRVGVWMKSLFFSCW